MAPRNFCDKLSQIWARAVTLIESAHIPNVSCRKTAHVRKLPLQICRQSLNDRLAPTLLLLSLNDLLAYFPVQQDKFLFYRFCGFGLSATNSCFESVKAIVISSDCRR